MSPEDKPSPLAELWNYLTGGSADARADGPPTYERTEDVIYGRKDGMALTLDVFRPTAGGNGRALLWIVSGIWFSSREGILPVFIEPMIARGYTVFAVLHGSQPRYTVPEILPDIHRAVRFVRNSAERFGIDPGRIGIYGGSSGGHLSLMQAVTGRGGSLLTRDPVERESSRVQAAAVFFPPTDFLNWGEPGVLALGLPPLQRCAAAFAFHRYDEVEHLFTPIDKDEEIVEEARLISPVTYVSKDDPPVLLMHGDIDPLVPLQQSRDMIARLNAVGVEAELIVKPMGVHGWPGIDQDLFRFADWFDRHLGVVRADR